MVKLTKKKRLIVIISSVLLLAIAGTSTGVAVAKKNEGTEVQFQTIGTEDIQSSINATADVEAGATKEYKVSTMATVNDVNVRVGDKVTQGQLLATFDTSAMDQQISELQKQYSSTNASYKASLAAANEAKSKLDILNAQIAALETKIAAAAVTNPSDAKLPDLSSGIPQELYDRIQKAIVDLAAQGNMTPESIQKAIEDVVSQAVADGLIENNQVPDLDQITGEMNGAISGVSDEMQLAALKMQRQVLEITANLSMTDTTKTLMNSTSEAIKLLKEQRDVLAAGWTADFDGVITQVNIEPGGETSLLKAGIVLQGTEVMTAVITLGKYDIQKVTVGMPCKISVVNGTYDGEVSFIAPTADNSSTSSEILDSMSSSFGISGLGSLTGSSGGVRCEITIFHPDEKVIIGLDANVEITLDQKEDAVALPVECLKMDKEGKYVFLYNEKDKTVVKQPVTVGVNSDLYYEVTQGLKKGDMIAASELSALEDGQRVKVSTKTTTKK